MESGCSRSCSAVPSAMICPPRCTGSRTDLDNVIGAADRIDIVLDDDDRIADIAQLLQRLDDTHAVSGMQPDTRLVQYIQHPHQP